ncbi:28S ribosomal protein S7, mitochondrial [Callorhinchus milii]|uniref:Small ribosomal subunit protein uS7m n=1 Tax=Callorhinchus milii TaxID=7868 RepID=K4GBV5_CALMI|nr:small ribosomal subunit protein uS7m [Callorhinchus milii]AFM90829.1 28S ribosomal protein S7, mitochondrial precursor [Callorhinchus milii]
MAAAAVTGLFIKSRVPGVIPVRWSRYSQNYLEPEVNREYYRAPVTELSQEEKDIQELKRVRPIKAAQNSITGSVFYDPLLSKFINMIMTGGQKKLARSIMNETFELIKRKQVELYHKAPEANRENIECNPYKIFHRALENCKPVIGLTNIQRGGKTYQVPTPLKDNRRRFLAMKWLITHCQESKSLQTHMSIQLSQELLAAFNNEGNVIKRKHDLHKMAEANRAFAHYRWW